MDVDTIVLGFPLITSLARAMSVKHMHRLNLGVLTGQLFETVPAHGLGSWSPAS